MQRRNGPAIRDTLLWIGLLVLFGGLGVYLWFSVWSLLCFAVYGVLYGSASDARWHECGHGTAFKTRWMNTVVYNLACFMIMRDPTVWRWSHARHHTDTIIVGRDPEIVAHRPPPLGHIAARLLRALGGASGVQAHVHPRIRPDDSGRGDLRSRHRMAEDVLDRACVVDDLCRGRRGMCDVGQHPAGDGHRAAAHVRRMAPHRHRSHAAQRSRRGRHRSSAQQPHRVHEPVQPLRVLEHELPRRAPHVPDGPVPCLAGAARRDQGRSPDAARRASPLRSASSCRCCFASARTTSTASSVSYPTVPTRSVPRVRNVECRIGSWCAGSTTSIGRT